MPDASMTAVRVHQFGGADQLQLETIARPQPKAGEVLVRVQAVGVLPAEVKTRQGYFKDFRPTTFPYIPGSAFSGVVEAVGESVTGFALGDAVFGRTNNGAYAEYLTATADTVALKPKGVSFADAATISGGGTTAWVSLFDNAHIEAGQRVLVHAAAGGVGLFAVQLARWKGAHVTGTASAANLDFVRSLGAEAVDYAAAPFEDTLKDFDVVLDAVGGDTTTRSMKALKRGGVLVSLLGEPDQTEAHKHGIRATSNSVSQPFPSTELLQTIAGLMADGTVKTAIAAEYPLADVRQAHERVETGHSRGRVVLRVGD